MSQIQPLWTVYPDVHNNFKSKFEACAIEIRRLMNRFVFDLTCFDEPQLYQDVFSCHEESAFGFRIGNRGILFRPETLDQGVRIERILHLIDIIQIIN